eukprot:Opistho-1_new@74119
MGPSKPMGSDNIVVHVVNNAQKHLDKLAMVIAGKEEASYRDLLRRIGAIASMLRRKGVKRGDRVILTVPLCIDFYAVTLAVFAVGGVVVLVDPTIGIKRVNHCIRTARPRVWLRRNRSMCYLKLALSSLREIPLVLDVTDELLRSSRGPLELKDIEADVEHALITFTTGSTGMPKLLLRKHSFLTHQSHAIGECHARLHEDGGVSEESEVALTNLPVFALHFLKVGATCLLQPNIHKFYPAAVVDMMERYKCTTALASPAFVEKIAAHCLLKGRQMPLRETVVGGAPIYHSAFKTLVKATPKGEVVIVYGSTEAEPISMVRASEKGPAEAANARGLCVGMPFIPGGVKVIKASDDDWKQTPIASIELPRNEIGEIIVSGWQVNTYEVPASRILKGPDGAEWLRTGDAGYLDDKGMIWLAGRVSWAIARDGKVFWSTIVEQFILDALPDLTFAAYLPHENRAHLVIESPDPTSEEMRRRVRKVVVDQGYPVDEYVFMRHIPRDRRHASKPDPSKIFAPPSALSAENLIRWSPYIVLALFVLVVLLLRSNGYGPAGVTA